jgi:hypothetical protein
MADNVPHGGRREFNKSAGNEEGRLSEISAGELVSSYILRLVSDSWYE